jgi:hypothetical protein
MRTPAGKECPYFFGDYYRGRKHEECRLIGRQSPPNHWTPDLCKTCPVPAISMANACPHLVLSGSVSSGILGIGRKVKVSAYCTLVKKDVKDPYVGCGQCHPLPDIFTEQDKKP